MEYAFTSDQWALPEISFYSTLRIATAPTSTHISWLNSQARKDLSIGVKQEDPTMAPIFESELEPEALIDPQLRRAPDLSIELRIESSHSEPELGIELGIESSHSEPELGIELGIELRRGTRLRVPAQHRTFRLHLTL
jgi:hypothetical protein